MQFIQLAVLIYLLANRLDQKVITATAAKSLEMEGRLNRLWAIVKGPNGDDGVTRMATHHEIRNLEQVDVMVLDRIKTIERYLVKQGMPPFTAVDD